MKRCTMYHWKTIVNFHLSGCHLSSNEGKLKLLVRHPFLVWETDANALFMKPSFSLTRNYSYFYRFGNLIYLPYWKFVYSFNTFGLIITMLCIDVKKNPSYITPTRSTAIFRSLFLHLGNIVKRQNLLERIEFFKLHSFIECFKRYKYKSN